MTRLACILCIACLLTGCRGTVAVAIGGNATATAEQGKTYDGVEIAPDFSIPFP